MTCPCSRSPFRGRSETGWSLPRSPARPTPSAAGPPAPERPSMTAHSTGDPAIPDSEERAARNAALFAHNFETGFWDDQRSSGALAR
jgi:hypothetical protein